MSSWKISLHPQVHHCQAVTLCAAYRICEQLVKFCLVCRSSCHASTKSSSTSQLSNPHRPLQLQICARILPLPHAVSAPSAIACPDWLCESICGLPSAAGDLLALVTSIQNSAWLVSASSTGLTQECGCRQDKQGQEQSAAQLTSELLWLEGAFDSAGPYLAGSQFSLVDAAIIPWFLRMYVLKEYRQA